MKRVLATILAGALLLLLSIVGTGVADVGAQVPEDQTSGHAIDANEGGDVVVAAIKQSGALWTRTLTDGAWADWVNHGQDTWTSADVAIDDDGNITLIGLKQSGQLWTRDLTADALGDWTRHGQPTWSTETVPSIDTNSGTTTLAAVKEDGSLYTRTRAVEEDWASWVRHGARNWAHAEIAVDSDGVSALAGTKADGALWTNVVTPERGAWELQGEGFSTEMPLSLSLNEDVLALGFIDAAGSAFIRTGTLDTSATPVQQWLELGTAIESDVAAITVSVATDRLAFAYITNDGELKKWGWEGTPGAYTPEPRPVFLGFSGWSTVISPAIAVAGDGQTDALLAPGADGALAALVEGADDFRSYIRLGRPTWAVGEEPVDDDDTEEPVEITEYEPGLYLVSDDALPADRYQIESAGQCAWVRLESLNQQTLLDGAIGSSIDPNATQNVIDILPTDGAFQLIDIGGTGCGSLEVYEAPATLLSTISEGTYVVGDDIEPGRYVSDTPCNWVRLSDFEGTPASELTYDAAVFSGRQIVDVLASDIGFRVTGNCNFSFRVAPTTPATEFDAGMYVVRSDIAAGRYVVSAGCSFGRLSGFSGRSPATDEYLDVLGGFPTSVSPLEGGDWIIDIDPTDTGFLLGSIDGATCAAALHEAPDTPTAAPIAGSNVVGVDFEPGLYVAPGGTGCFWTRLSGFGWTAGEAIDGNANQNTEVLVNIDAEDIGFHASSFCGRWTPFSDGAAINAINAATAAGSASDLLTEITSTFKQAQVN